MPLDLNDKQVVGLEALMDFSNKYILFSGGSRCGKTVLICEWLVQRAFQYEGSLQLCARLHRTDIEMSFFDRTLKDYLKEFIPKELYSIRESDLKIVFANGSEILCAGLDDKDRVEKILGNEYLTIFVNEATQVAYDTIMMLITRLAQRVRDRDDSHFGVNKMVLDCNPRSKRHWLYNWGVLFRDPYSKERLVNAHEHCMIHWTPYDNIKHLGQDFIDTLDAMEERMRRRMLLGEWVSGEGAVFTEFDDEVHIVAPFRIPKNWNVYMAIDFGFNHPFGCVWVAVSPDDEMYVFNTFRKREKTTSENADVILEYNRKYGVHPKVIWADHSAGDRRTLAQKNLRTKLAKKNVVQGIDAIKDRLSGKRPRLYIFDTCMDLVDEISGYQWLDDNANSARDAVVKLEDDLLDCLRYICMGLIGASNLKNF
jgi:PBSX family phage terminase large subunit